MASNMKAMTVPGGLTGWAAWQGTTETSWTWQTTRQTCSLGTTSPTSRQLIFWRTSVMTRRRTRRASPAISRLGTSGAPTTAEVERGPRPDWRWSRTASRTRTWTWANISRSWRKLLVLTRRTPRTSLTTNPRRGLRDNIGACLWSRQRLAPQQRTWPSSLEPPVFRVFRQTTTHSWGSLLLHQLAMATTEQSRDVTAAT